MTGGESDSPRAPQRGHNHERGDPLLSARVPIPDAFTTTERVDGETLTYGGDIRIGDLDGDGEVEFLVFRSTDDGMKPTFLGAFDRAGDPLWSVGSGGTQPARPGAVTIYDLDGDGDAEVLHVGTDGSGKATSMDNAVLRIRDGATGDLLFENAPVALTARSGEGANWVHQRPLVAHLRDTPDPRDFVLKLGSTLVAFDDGLDPLWSYDIEWNEYGQHTAYVPAVGDIDGDGRDEVLGGHYLLDHDGSVRWARYLADHMDSVAITAWNGEPRAVCSGGGHVVDADGETVLELGPEVVPHGQEVRVGNFFAGDAGGSERDAAAGQRGMALRYDGHEPSVLFVDELGTVIERFELNHSPNHTGMMDVRWHGNEGPDLLYNGGVLWRADGTVHAELPELPEPAGPEKMGWYHCIPADVCGDEREEVVVYNPWDDFVAVYTPTPFEEGAFDGYEHGPRQYNPRIMD